jgi:outer membrane protein TolC
MIVMVPRSGRFVIACVFFIAFPILIVAQGQPAPVPPQLTLEQAMQLLLSQNPLLLRDRQNLAIAQANVRQARQLLNPELELNSAS